MALFHQWCHQRHERYMYTMIIVIKCIMVIWFSDIIMGSSGVYGIAQMCNTSVGDRVCPGVEFCNYHSSRCECPFYSLNWDGIWSTQTRLTPSNVRYYTCVCSFVSASLVSTINNNT
jgi:hypothetical protein